MGQSFAMGSFSSGLNSLFSSKSKLLLISSTGALMLPLAFLSARAASNSSINSNHMPPAQNNIIDNNINVNAVSGDANVTKNTTAGNAATGDADAAVNLLNISSSNMSFADWLGILFINVFGKWNGSFGVNTSAGDPAVNPTVEGENTNLVPGQIKIIQFVPNSARTVGTTSGGTNNSFQTTENVNTDSNSQPEQQPEEIIGATDSESNGTPAGQSNAFRSFFLPILGSGLMGAFLLALEQIQKRRSLHKNIIKPSPQIIRPV